MDIENPKVSIIVPIYNVEKYLSECLESLINQTLTDIEIICINDGSTDNSLQILKEYSSKDNRIKVIDQQNQGYGVSMNKGLETAKGEYVGIIESDDFADLNMFEDLYQIAKKYNAEIVKSDFYYYTTNTKRVRKAGKIALHKCGKIINIKKHSSILKIVPSIWSAIYKNEFLQKNNIRFIETPGASFQDTSFQFKALSAAERIVFTPKSYLYYRNDNENSSVKSKDKIFSICVEYQEITNYLNEHPEIKQYANPVKLIIQFKAYRWNTLRIDESCRDEFIAEFQKEFQEYFNNGEITKEFYKKIKQKELKMLLEDKTEYRKYIDNLSLESEKSERRRKNFSIRINSSRISIVLFGKQILEIG